MDTSILSLGDKNLEYLLYIDYEDGAGKVKIGLWDLEQGKRVQQFDWKLDDTSYMQANNLSGVYFYASRNTNYDFHIVYNIGSCTAAEGYLKIGDKAITTVYDKTSVGAEYYLSNSK